MKLMNYIAHLILILTVHLASYNLASGQIIKLNPPPSKIIASPALDKIISEYKIYTSEIVYHKASYRNGSDLDLQIGEKQTTFTITTHNLKVTKKLNHDIAFLHGTSKYGQTLNLTLADNFLQGFIQNGPSKTIIQPLSYFDKSVESNLYIVYQEDQLIELNQTHTCGHSLKEEAISEQLLRNPTSCKLVDIAIANTSDMLQKYGTEEALVNRNLAVLNDMQTIYRSEFGINIEFNVVASYIPTSTANEPFADNNSGINAAILLPQFRQWASTTIAGRPNGQQGGFATDFDLAVVWTDRNINQNGNNIIGLAFTPGFYSILEDYTASTSRLAVLMSHEIAHNFGSSHDDSGTTIMSPSLQLTDVWSPASVTSIENQISTYTFLDDCSSLGVPNANFIQSTTATCIGSTVNFEDQSQYGVTRNWTFENATPTSSTDAKTSTTFNALGYQNITIASTNEAGTNSHTKSILILDSPISNCNANGNTGSGGITTFSIENVLNPSETADQVGNYENFGCEHIISAEPGQTYETRIGLAGVSNISIYIDVNGDGDFNNTNELINSYIINSDGTYAVDIPMPSNPQLGQIIKLRLVTSNVTIPNACISPSVGQVEDYGLFFPGNSVPGCTDTTADNYNPNATIDDGSCVYSGISTNWYRDLDGDGYGDINNSQSAETQPIGYVENDIDCDDSNPNVNPNAAEICDGIDNNCDNSIDEGLITATYYFDQDNDGYGNPSISVNECQAPNNYVNNNLDCNDNNPNIHPFSTEVCDDIDNNCNGEIDELLYNTYYADNDGDGYGDASTPNISCDLPLGYVDNSEDCDDDNPNIHPGSDEVCDNIDNDCNGTIDDGVVTTTYFRDSDGDGYGNASVIARDCLAPQGYVDNDQDCDDNNPNVNPESDELCDNLDNDCNGIIDDGTLTNTYFLDNDGDGYGNGTVSLSDCTAPEGYVDNNQDCNDSDPNINPNSEELCDNLDNNCNGLIDDVDMIIRFYKDSDQDGYGVSADYIEDCNIPVGYSRQNGDCNDNNPNINPASEEICDNIDNNCDGQIDEDACGVMFIWEDLNLNNRQDGEETGIKDIGVKLYDAETKDELASDITDQAGRYSLGQIEPGQYQIAYDLSNTSKNYILHEDLDSDITFERKDGVYLSSIIELEGDNNLPVIALYEGGSLAGTYTYFETGSAVEEAQVYLYTKTPTFTLLDSTSTDSDGQYVFNSIRIGNYFLEFEAPEGHTFTSLNQVNSSIINSYENNEGELLGQTETFNVEMSSNIINVDAIARQESLTILAFQNNLSLYGEWADELSSNQLSWENNLNTEIEKIELQRGLSTDNLKTIYTTKFSTQDAYQDKIYEPATYYYRLKITLSDQRIKYSDLISVRSTPQQFLKLYPNPTNNLLIIEGLDIHDSIDLYNTNGVKLNNYLKEKSDNNLKLNLSSVKSGIYYLRVMTKENGFTVKKLIISR